MKTFEPIPTILIEEVNTEIWCHKPGLEKKVMFVEVENGLYEVRLNSECEIEENMVATAIETAVQVMKGF